MKKISMFLFLFSLVLTAYGCNLPVTPSNTNKNVNINKNININENQNENENKNLIGGQKDEHDCLIPAGYSWCETKQKCLRTWEEPCETTEEKIEIFKKLFAEKYKKNISDITVTIDKESENHVRGGLKLSKDKEAPGAIFLATKGSGSWAIVFDGNGNISCKLLEPYNFPQNMIEDCS